MSDTTETRWERHNEAGRRYFAQGELGQAEEAFKAAIREATLLGAENLRLAASLSNLGQLKYKQKDLTQAEALFRRSLAIREHVLGTEHQGIVQSVNNLAALHYARGELDQAEPLFRRALSITETQLGSDHADVAGALNNLARLSFRRNDTAAAAPLLTRLLELKERSLGPNHPEIAGILLSLVKVRIAAREHAEAEALCRRALGIREGHAQSDADPAVASALEVLAEICGAQGKHDEQRHALHRARLIRGTSGLGEQVARPLAEHGSGPVARPSQERARPSIEIPARSLGLSQEMHVIGRETPSPIEQIEVMPIAAQFAAPQAPAAKSAPSHHAHTSQPTASAPPYAEPRSEPRSGPRPEPFSGPRAEPFSGPRAEPFSGPRTEPRSEPRSGPKLNPPVYDNTDFDQDDADEGERNRTPSAVARAARSRTPAQQPRFPRRIPTPARLAMAAASAPADDFDPDSGTLPTPEAAPAEVPEVSELSFGRPQPRRWGVIGGIAAAIALAAVTAWAMVGRDHAEGGASAPVVENASASSTPAPMTKPATTPSTRAPATVVADTETISGGSAPIAGEQVAPIRDEDESSATARRPALGSAPGQTPQKASEDGVAMPNKLPNLGIDKVFKDVEQNAKARVDSASRTIQVKPPTFGRP
ncbi:MAG TPA: tetratricopeptide repeat protein [Gemmatimonadaceae bacterium]|nr:tetratricopeptide repeat protein [Gemmatimonadaceae bacterium]